MLPRHRRDGDVLQAQEVYGGEGFGIFENEFEYPDGSKAWFELSVQLVPEGIIVLSIDITEQRRVEEHVRYLNQLLGTIHFSVLCFVNGVMVYCFTVARAQSMKTH